MTRRPCPEALYGIHGDPNSNGNCPYCGDRLTSRRQYGTSRGVRYGTRSMPDEILEHELHRREPVEDQDPIAMDRSFEDSYYEA